MLNYQVFVQIFTNNHYGFIYPSLFLIVYLLLYSQINHKIKNFFKVDIFNKIINDDFYQTTISLKLENLF